MGVNHITLVDKIHLCINWKASPWGVPRGSLSWPSVNSPSSSAPGGDEASLGSAVSDEPSVVITESPKVGFLRFCLLRVLPSKTHLPLKGGRLRTTKQKSVRITIPFITQKSSHYQVWASLHLSNFLLSRDAAVRVSSALRSLTSVFGMGTGVSSALLSLSSNWILYLFYPNIVISYLILQIIFHFSLGQALGLLVSVS